MASGAFAAHSAMTCGTGLSSAIGRSKYRGGLRGLGDQAAADASIALIPKSEAAKSSAVVTFAARSRLRASGSMLAPRQQGLMAYRLEKTPGSFIPTRSVP